MPAIHRRQILDLRGSSEQALMAAARDAFGHPLQPGNSKTQNSPLDGMLAAVISNRQYTREGWTELAAIWTARICDMMLPVGGRIMLSVTD